MEGKNTGGDGDKRVESIPRYRASDNRATVILAVGVPLLGIIASLFVALSISNRDYSKAVSANVQSLGEQTNNRIQKLDSRVRDVERCTVKRRGCK